MTTAPTIEAPAPIKLAYTLAEFRAAGGPGRTKCYQLHAAGKLRLVKDQAGRTLVLAEEAERYFHNTAPVAVGGHRFTAMGRRSARARAA